MDQYAMTCIYCGGRGVSREHLWGRWSRPTLKADEKPFHKHTVERPLDPFDTDSFVAGAGPLSRPGHPRSQSLRIACEKCNNGWMADIQENAAEPLTALGLGKWHHLDEDAQTAIARWAALFTMSWETADRQTACIDAAERDRFRRETTLGGQWAVAVGLSIIPDDSATYHRALLMHDEETGDVICRAQVTAILFDRLVMVTYFQDLAEPVGQWWFDHLFKNRLRTIHPFRSATLFEPDLIGFPSLEAYAKSLLDPING